jgi:hypothetical protein
MELEKYIVTINVYLDNQFARTEEYSVFAASPSLAHSYALMLAESHHNNSRFTSPFVDGYATFSVVDYTRDFIKT